MKAAITGYPPTHFLFLAKPCWGEVAQATYMSHPKDPGGVYYIFFCFFSTPMQKPTNIGWDFQLHEFETLEHPEASCICKTAQSNQTQPAESSSNSSSKWGGERLRPRGQGSSPINFLAPTILLLPNLSWTARTAFLPLLLCVNFFYASICCYLIEALGSLPWEVDL